MPSASLTKFWLILKLLKCIIFLFPGDRNNAPETSSSAVKDPVPQTPKIPAAPHDSVELTPPPTPLTPRTSKASFFLNLNHSYVAQTEPNPEIKTGEHAYRAQAEPKHAEPNPEIKVGPTRVTAANDQSQMEFDDLLILSQLYHSKKIY